MRWIVLGAGAVGGLVGARLFEAGHEVVLVARGPHREALARRGLTLRTPSGARTLAVPVASSLAEARVGQGDVLLVAVKSQHLEALLPELRAQVPSTVPVLCALNGVENEDLLGACFARVYGVMVWMPCAHLTPGEVIAYAVPTYGVLDLGLHPREVDRTATQLAQVLEGSGISARTVPDIARWKRTKLLTNLGNLIDALVAEPPPDTELERALVAEARAVFARCGLAVDDPEEMARGCMARMSPMEAVDGAARPGGSTYQSLARGTGALETEHLNGAIVRLAERAGMEAPLNRGLVALGKYALEAGLAPKSMAFAELEARVRGG